MAKGEWVQLHGRSEYESSFGVIGCRGDSIPPETKWWNHMSAEKIRQQVGVDVWDSYFKFCVIRNPFEKCISAYEHFGPRFEMSNIIDSNNESLSNRKLGFLKFVTEHAPVDRDKYTIDGIICMDDFIRFESLEEDLRRICGLLDLPFEPEYLPNFNSDIRNQESTIQNLYSLESQRIVRETFAFELETFRYELPS